jgi:hypothetical protein
LEAGNGRRYVAGEDLSAGAQSGQAVQGEREE